MIKYLFFILMAIPSLSMAQTNVNFADLSQDVAIMRREIGQLRLEVEQLKRENSNLAIRVKKTESGSVSSDLVVAQTGAIQNNVDAKLASMKAEIISKVKQDLDSMASQTNVSMQKLANAMESKPAAALPVSFSSDFPKSGFNYTVQSGDSLSKIARTYNSRIKWIQDANQIVNPSRDLQVGKAIFVPQQ